MTTKAASILISGFAFLACQSSSGDGGLEDALRHSASGDAGTDGSSTATVVQGPGSTYPNAQPVTVDPNPNAPLGNGGQTIPWTGAPVINDVQAIIERDSVRVILPSVAGAQDFRVFAIDDTLGVTPLPNGAEHIKASTVVCAGYRQRGIPTSTMELVPQVEFAGLTAATRIVVEAVDTTCPFTGLQGSAHQDVTTDNPEIDPSLTGVYSVYTESEIVASYDALILNGQGANLAHPGQPAPLVDPKVLARTTFSVTPLGYASPPPAATFFDDFSKSDPLTVLSDGNYDAPYPYFYVMQNSKWTFQFVATVMQQVLIDRNRLHVLLADDGQDDFSSMVATPRQLAHISSSDYLHITYEVTSETTDRRYWWLSLCGADQAGKTLGANGVPTSFLNAGSGLQEASDDNPSVKGDNCLMLFERNGAAGNGPMDLPPDNTVPETDALVLQYQTGTGETGINLSPDQYNDGYMEAAWYRQIDAKGNMVASMLDDQNLAAPTTHYDIYVRSNRLVMYVNGQQRLCNDFTSKPLTMAEGMIGFGQVLYHTADEHVNYTDIPGYPAGSLAMRNVFQNTLYMDRRDWDNMGFGEHVALPGDMPTFDESVCYKSP